MKREQAYTLIDMERDTQDALWRVGRNNEGQYKFAAPHILLLEESVDKLRKLWYTSEKEQLTKRFTIIAALAVRALEEINIE